MAEETSSSGSDSRDVPEVSADNVTIGSVREASGDERQLIEAWGKFWGQRSDFHGVFDVIYDISRDTFKRREYRAFEERSVVDSVEVPEEHDAFSRKVASMQTAPGIPDATIPQINSFVKEFFEDPDNRASLIDGLKKQDSRSLSDTLWTMVRTIIPRGEIGYEAGISLTTETTGRSDSTTREHPTDQSGDDEESGTEDDRLEATVSTDPVNGVQPRNLNAGDVIYVHVKGDVVERLPDELSHDRYDQLTVPMAAVIQNLSEDFAAPDGYEPEEFQQSDFWKIECQLEDYDNLCRAIVQRDTKIKSDVEPGPGTVGSIFAFLFSPLAILWLALTILGAMILGYLLLGV